MKNNVKPIPEKEHRRRALLAELASLEEMEDGGWDAYKENLDEPLLDRACLYLEKLRVTGEVNMYEASPYVARRYGLTDRAAREILLFWMTHREMLTSGASAAKIWKKETAKKLANSGRDERVRIIKALPKRPF